ncbi:hypothetical protein JOM56_000291 [Amanita muscaria]
MPQLISLDFMQDRRRYPSHHSILTATTPPWLRQPPLELGSHSSHYSALIGSFAAQDPDWSAMPITCAAALPDNFTYCAQSAYPDSTPVNPPPTDYHFQAEIPRSTSHSPVSNDDGHHLYTMDEIVETTVSCRSSAKRSPSVKVEQPDVDGCFVMELSAAQVNTISLSQSMAPPTEVPLRATHASEEMRKMMGRFRIDPFAIHNGEQRGVVASWCDEACPLEEEPLIFEFQLDIVGQEDSNSKDSSSDDASAGRASQDASSEIDCDWERYGRDETVYASNPPSEWNINDSGDQPPSSSEPPAGLYHQHIQGLQESAYLRNCPEVDSQICERYLQPATSAHDVRTQHVEHHGQFWHRRGAYDTASRTTAYCVDSPECDNAILPSISATVNRRWSVPDPNSAHAAQFLMH